jgi:tRNA-splicing ligase RtcB
MHMTEGVECRKDANVIDETPAACKTDRRGDGGSGRGIVHTLHQVVCVKGQGSGKRLSGEGGK